MSNYILGRNRSKSEILEILKDVKIHFLDLLVISEWHNEIIIMQNSFLNNNTFEIWKPFPSRINVPTIKLFYKNTTSLFGEKVVSGDLILIKNKLLLIRPQRSPSFPSKGYLISAELDDESYHILGSGLYKKKVF